MEAEDQYYWTSASAFVRGRLGLGPEVAPDETLRAARAAGLRLHKFKRTMGLPRVRRVLGVLRGLHPSHLLDIGSGRGVFLWPLLDAFPDIPVTAVDSDTQRAADIGAVRLGGVGALHGAQMDAPRALAEAVRVARRFVVLSVPSHADDNPQHIHLFTRTALTELFTQAGAASVTVDGVLNHWVAVARLPEKG